MLETRPDTTLAADSGGCIIYAGVQCWPPAVVPPGLQVPLTLSGFTFIFGLIRLVTAGLARDAGKWIQLSCGGPGSWVGA